MLASWDLKNRFKVSFLPYIEGAVMVSGLTVLNDAYIGHRMLWWVDDPGAKLGYNVYRAFDQPVNWTRINDTPIPGHLYTDSSRLETVTFTVGPTDWIDKGELGSKAIKLPEVPYSEVVKGQPVVATGDNDVTIIADGVSYRPARVAGADRIVYLRTGVSLPLGGAVSDFNLIDWDAVNTLQIQYRRLANYVDIYTTLTRTFYCVVSLDEMGRELHPPGCPGSSVADTLQVDKMDYIQAEMVRRNAWIFEQTGEPAWLLFRRTKGVVCSCLQNEVGQPRTGCPVCYETGIVGGYYGPYDFLYIDPDVGALRTIDENGIKVERQSRSYLGPSPIVQDGDLVVRKNGERLVISQVTYKSPRGVLLQQEFNTELLNRRDTRYLIPLRANPQTYNPIRQPDTPTKEPIVTQDKAGWQNKDKQPGRTITFGRIQGGAL